MSNNENTQTQNSDQQATEESSSTFSKKKLCAAPFKNEIGEQNSFFIVIIHFLHFTKELNDFFMQESFEKDINYIILFVPQ